MTHPRAHHRHMRYTPPSSSPDPIEHIRAQTRARINRYGFTKLVIGAGECATLGCCCLPDKHSYAYTLGMCDYLSPEFVVFGLPMAHIADAVDPICEAVMTARRMPIGDDHRIELRHGPDVCLIEVPDDWVAADSGRVAAWFDLYAPRRPSFVQICWSDEFGNMPWEPACNPAISEVQPILANDPFTIPPPYFD